jgi:hypothetical protein
MEAMEMLKTAKEKLTDRFGGFTGFVIDRKEDLVMKGIKKTLVIALTAVIAVSAGCIWHEDDPEDDGYYYHDGCCYYDPGPVVEYWEVCGDDLNTLYVGEECGCGGCDPCFECCTFSDYDYSIDTIYLDSWDEALVDLQLNYTITNWGYDATYVWVTLCDEVGCEDVIETDLYPGEVYYGRAPNPVLDTALDEFYDCLWFWGDLCWFDYDIEVYVGEECTCSPVTLDYYFEGLYVY